MPKRIVSLVAACLVASAPSLMVGCGSGVANVVTATRAVTSVAIVPGEVTLRAGESQTMSVSVTNAAVQDVTWKLDGSIGTISKTGLYTAPEQVAETQSLVVTATSIVDPSSAARAKITLLASGAPVLGTYYVDEVNGADTNSGISPLQAFATVARVNKLNLDPGQTVAFRAGGVWHETLNISRSGLANKPITYTSYGTGPKPVLSASDTVSGWTRAASSVWRHTQPSSPYVLNFAGTPGIHRSSSSPLKADNEWSWDGRDLLVFSATDPSKIVEIPQRPWAVSSAGANYIRLMNLEVRGAQSSDVYCNAGSGCQHWAVTGNSLRDAYTNGLVLLSSDTAPAGYLTFTNNIVSGSGGSGVALNGSMSSEASITGNEFYDLCNAYQDSQTVIGDYWNVDNTFCDAIKTYASKNLAGSGTYIAENNIHDIGVGQSENYGGGIHLDTTYGGLIERNTVTNTNASGIQIEKTKGGTVARYNLVVRGGVRHYSAGIMVRAGDGMNIEGAAVYNNTAYGGWWACTLLIQQNEGSATAVNTSFQKNICSFADSGTQFYSEYPDSRSAAGVLQNGFGVPAPYFIVLNAAPALSYAAVNRMMGFDLKSVEGDPLFVDAANGDFHLRSGSPAAAIGAFPAVDK